MECSSAIVVDNIPHLLYHLSNDNCIDINRFKESAHQCSLHPQHVPSRNLITASHGQNSRRVGATRFRPKDAKAGVVVTAPGGDV